MGDVGETVVVVFVVVTIGREVMMVDPDIWGLDCCQIKGHKQRILTSPVLDGDSVIINNLLNSEVTENDVGDTLDSDGEFLEDDLAVLNDDRLVAANLDVVAGTIDGASDKNNGGIVALDGNGELAEGRNLNGITALATGGVSISGGVSNSGDILEGGCSFSKLRLGLIMLGVGAAER